MLDIMARVSRYIHTDVCETRQHCRDSREERTPCCCSSDAHFVKTVAPCSRSGKAQLSHFRSVQEALARNPDLVLGQFR